MKTRLIIRFRPLIFIFKRNWYSIGRWKTKQEYPMSGGYCRLIDFGIVTFGYGKHNINDTKED